MAPGPNPELTRRQALRLLLAAAVAGAGACTAGGRRQVSGPSSTSTTGGDRPSSSTSSTTTTSPPTTAGSPTSTASTEPPSSTTTEAPPSETAPPADPSGALTGFVAFGDSGGGAAQGAVAAAMTRWAAAHRVDVVVTTGDNVYDFGEPHLFAAQLDEPYRELRAGRHFWVTLGNHDVVRGHGPAQLAHLGLPPLPYSGELAGVRFLFLDSSAAVAPQAAWLEEELARPGAACSVVVFHAPIYSCGLHGPHPPLVGSWAPIIERHRATLVLNGHDHLYNRFLSTGGVSYVVTGGGGRDLYAHTPSCQPPELRFSAVRHHFVGVEVFTDRVVVSAVGTDGSVFDRFEIPVAVPVTATP